MSGIAAVVWAFAISIVAHFAVGAVKIADHAALVGGRQDWK